MAETKTAVEIMTEAYEDAITKAPYPLPATKLRVIGMRAALRALAEMEPTEKMRDAAYLGNDAEDNAVFGVDEARAYILADDKPMQFNNCDGCGANNGKAGLLISDPDIADGKALCMNCRDTARTGHITIHSYLPRTAEECEKTFAFAAPKATL